MNIHRLSDAGIRNVDLLFLPAGFPLVSKAGTEPPTTSILVRGGAGTGKTTMSLALAHAIARANAGAVLFLTTEFSPAEVVVKASLLGLAAESVLAWGGRSDAQQGSILVQHLTATGVPENDDEPSVSAGLKQRTMEAVWDMLAESPAPATPVRALVIDAFGLPDPEEKPGKLRSDLVPFIQALEKRGVSTVLVEEAIAGGPDWLAFVTDVVFELSFQVDTETSELHRKVVCKKSRYAQAIPGPHDYGLEVMHKRPSVFPDPLLSLGSSRPGAVAIPKERRAALFVPTSEDGEGVILRNGALLLNAFDRAGQKITNAFRSTADIRPVSWECGPVTTLAIDKHRIRLHESAGPYAMCDAALSLIEKAKANAVYIHKIGTLASSSRYRTGLPRVLDGLRRHGCLVLVHGTTAETTAFLPFADVDAEHVASGMLRFRPRRYCPVSVHLPSVEILNVALRQGPFDRMPTEAEGRFASQLFNAVRNAEERRAQGDVEAALKTLSCDWAEHQMAIWSPWVASAYFLLSVVRRRLGMTNDPRLTYIEARMPVGPMDLGQPDTEILEQLSQHTELHGGLAWAFAVMGNEPAAAYWCLQAFERSNTRLGLDSALWHAVQAMHVRSPAALDNLLKLAVNAVFGTLFIGMAVRALVLQKRADEIERLVTEFLQYNPLPAFMEQRLRLEPLLLEATAASVEKARDGLISLAGQADIPQVHRAEVLHNIGYAHERLGKIVGARTWYERAQQENPHLTAAVEALARFEKQPPLDVIEDQPDGPDDTGPSDGVGEDVNFDFGLN